MTKSNLAKNASLFIRPLGLKKLVSSFEDFGALKL